MYTLSFVLLFLLVPLSLFSNIKETVNRYPNKEKVSLPPCPPDENEPSYRAIFQGEFLYWLASSSNFAYGVEYKRANSLQAPIKKLKFDKSWEPGIRLGIGMVIPHDGWKIFLNWSYFYGSESASKVGDSNVFSSEATTFTTPWIINPNFDQFSSLKGKWDIGIHQIDLTLRRKLGFSPHLDSSFVCGLKGYVSRLQLSVNAFRPLILGTQNLIDEFSRHTQKAWGVGFLGRLDSVWSFTRNWGLIGSGGFALTYGRSFIKTHSSLFQIDNSGVLVRLLNFNVYDVFYRLQSFIDLGSGIRYEKTFKNQVALNIDLLWELHFLYHFNQLTRGIAEFEFDADNFSTNGNLNLSGLVIRGQLKF